MSIITIGFHDVVEDLQAARPVTAGYTTVYTLDRCSFRAHLHEIRNRVGSTAVQCIETVPEPATSGDVLLTFDDGAAGSYECVAPELEAFGWRGHFFVTTGWIGQPGFLNRDQIAELHGRGHVIGSHSVTHPEQMSQLGWHELVREWSESCATLAAIIGEPVTVASVPGGYSSRKVCCAAAACGIRILFTSEPTTSASMVDGCLVLGRYAVKHSTPASVSGAIAAGAKGPRYREASLWLAKAAAKKLGGKWYLRTRRFLLHAEQ